MSVNTLTVFIKMVPRPDSNGKTFADSGDLGPNPPSRSEYGVYSSISVTLKLTRTGLDRFLMFLQSLYPTNTLLVGVLKVKSIVKNLNEGILQNITPQNQSPFLL